MKFKGIELKGSEAELLVEVEMTKEYENESEFAMRTVELEEKITNLLVGAKYDVYAENVCDGLVQVRCDEITLDSNGVDMLTYVYELVQNMNLSDVRITIGVNAGNGEWFEDANGHEYNEDMVTMEEFLEKVEY